MTRVIEPALRRVRYMKDHQEEAWKMFKQQRAKPLALPEKEAFLAALRGYAANEASADSIFFSEMR